MTRPQLEQVFHRARRPNRRAQWDAACAVVADEGLPIESAARQDIRLPTPSGLAPLGEPALQQGLPNSLASRHPVEQLDLSRQAIPLGWPADFRRALAPVVTFLAFLPASSVAEVKLSGSVGVGMWIAG
ncbi:MAG: hypothetical protein Q8K63_08955 [Acidimicrobiales bacterium]|nr:hypothetical protein [Acidimicrobiales bacterium]